jgi:hypothetical protein
MALPDALAFAWADKATLNACSDKKFRKGTDLRFSLWEVAAD